MSNEIRLLLIQILGWIAAMVLLYFVIRHAVSGGILDARKYMRKRKPPPRRPSGHLGVTRLNYPENRKQ